MSVISARNLVFSYGKEHVLTDMDLEVRTGELMVLLGANGSGKTTLLKLLAGHLAPTSGEVLLNDVSISSYSRKKLAQQLTLMPQLESRQVDMTLWEMVRLGRAASRGWWLPFSSEDDAAAFSAIEATGLIGLEDRPVATLSGGQWQRAVLARSLAQETEILLLDEPTSGLDLRHQLSCLQLVQKLVEERQLIAIVSLHDLQQAAMFADRVALIGEQRLLALGSCQDVLTSANIEQAYGVQTSVLQHPNHDRPLIVPLGTTDKLHS